MDLGSTKGIYKSTLKVVSSLNRFAIDYEKREIYFVDGNLMKKVDYEGKHMKHLNVTVVSENYLSIFKNRLYFVAEDTVKSGYIIQSMDTTTYIRDKESLYLKKENYGVMKVLDAQMQRTAENPCSKSNGGCEQLCLLASRISEGKLQPGCICSDGFNEISCLKSSEVDQDSDDYNEYDDKDDEFMKADNKST